MISIIWVISLSLINSILLYFVVYRYLHMLQLYNYKSKEFVYHFFKQSKFKFLVFDIFLPIILLCFIGHLLDYLLKNNQIYFYLLLTLFIVYFIYILATYINYIKIKHKKPLKYTNRVKRLIIGYILLSFILSFFAIYLFDDIVLSLDILYLSSAFCVLLLLITNIILLPLENYYKQNYIRKAKIKLRKQPDLIKIGITGSFGKTSTKNFLYTILSQKYSVCMTPLNYNTPMGIIKTILNDLNIGHQILIAEMGARYKNDIKELCNIVEPNFAIITSVGEQHLETFKSFENIKNEKYKLAESTNKVVVFNGEDQSCCEFYVKTSKEKLLVGFSSNFDVWADNIETSINGTSFSLHIKDDFIFCKTKMLGLLNLQNIVCASAMANILGLTLEEISNGIEKLQPIEHRMQLIKVNDNLTIVDNSYNGNLQGSKESLNILGQMNGTKIVVTPGMVELGNEQYNINYEFAKNMAQVADKVIVVNEINRKSLYEGLTNANFKSSNIFCIANLNEVYEILNKFTNQKCCVLFYNDLPDNYK